MYKGIFLADIHIGDMPLQPLKEELGIVLAYLEQNPVDFIVFGGDYFGHKMYLNDENSVFALQFLKDIFDRVKPECKIRMVYGTKSHEENQYEAFRPMTLTRDFRIIYNVTEEELFDDVWVLYLPEEQLQMDMQDYYEEYFKTPVKYSMIFGHGTIQEIMPEAAIIAKNRSGRVQSPVFGLEQLKKLVIQDEGIFFGHYHTHIYPYVGSYSRWKFDESVAHEKLPKGFYEITLNDDLELSCTLIENTKVPIYHTEVFDINHPIYTYCNGKSLDTDQMDVYLGECYDKLHDGIWSELRMKFVIPPEMENPELFVKYIREYFKNTKHVKVVISNGYIERRREIARKELQSSEDEFQMIYDRNVDLHKKVSFYISKVFHKDITDDETQTYLYKELDQILDQE